MATKHSNWRDDLREVVDSDSEDQNDNEIKEKKVKNKIDINPSIKESIESIGGQLIDIRKISEGKYEDCDCKGCGDDGVGHQNPCVECGGHHKEENEVYEATGRWVDSKGRSHTFSFDTNIVDHEYIKDLVKSRYPAKRIFIKTDKVKSKKKKAEKKVEKESFSNWRDEIVECGGHHKDKMSEGEMVVSEGETAAQKKRRLEVAKKEAKKKIRAIGPLKDADRDGDGWIRVIDAEYEPEGEMVENLTVDRVLKGIKGNPKAQKSFQKSAEKRKGPGTVKNRAADLKLQAAKDAADTSKSDSSYAYEEIEFAVDYFYEQGINEDGLDLIIEEIGLDAFVEFVLNPSEELMEERSARKMNVRTKKKMPAIVASDAEAEAKRRAGKTGEYKETPKKKAKVGSPAYTTTVKSEPKKKEAPKPVAKPVVKKVEKAVVKVKPTQPKKEVSKGGLRDRISGAVSGAVKAGVKRHKKAVQPARVFGKGVASGVRSAVRFAGKAKKAVVGEEVECNCDCGKDPCVKCGEGHHKLGEEKKSVEKKKRETLEKITKDAKDILKQDEIHSKIEEASVSGQELKYCKRCRKPETRNDCAYGPEEWDRSAVNIEWGEETVYEATGRWVDSKGRSHKFSISTNTVVDHGYIKDLVKSRYPAKRIFIKTDKEKSKKKKDAKKVKKESFSNWREENLTEHGNKNKPGYVNIGMGIWVKKEDAEKKKAQLAKSVRGENIPGFKGGRLD
jgi:hypothetical protein